MIKEREFVEDPLFIGMEPCKKKKFDGSTCILLLRVFYEFNLFMLAIVYPRCAA